MNLNVGSNPVSTFAPYPVPPAPPMSAKQMRELVASSGIKKLLPAPAPDRSKCGKCYLCVRNCPFGALRPGDVEDGGFPVLDDTKCGRCARCVNNVCVDLIWENGEERETRKKAKEKAAEATQKKRKERVST